MKYIDLGLPSGTLWSDTDYNETGRIYYPCTEIPPKLILPTSNQFTELLAFCNFYPADNHVICKGPNGNHIRFNYNGWCFPDSTKADCVGHAGYYWSSDVLPQGGRNILSVRKWEVFPYIWGNLQFSIREVYNNPTPITIF